MKLLHTMLWASAGIACLGLLGLSGCGEHKVRYTSEPVYVEPQPQYVIVREAPPAVIVDRRPPPPAGGYVWVDSYWHWDGRQYVRQGGQWARPPREHVIWVAPRYERHEQGYRYTPGQWREEQQERRRDDERRDKR